jgi:hypothetical protein
MEANMLMPAINTPTYTWAQALSNEGAMPCHYYSNRI